VFVGTKYGSVVVLDVTKPATPRCVYEKQVHDGPIILIELVTKKLCNWTLYQQRVVHWVNAWRFLQFCLENVGKMFIQSSLFLCSNLREKSYHIPQF